MTKVGEGLCQGGCVRKVGLGDEVVGERGLQPLSGDLRYIDTRHNQIRLVLLSCGDQ